MTSKPHYIREGCQAVSPWVITDDTAGFIAFITEVFGAEETGRVLTPDGTIGHAEAILDGSLILMFDRRPDWRPTPAFLRVYVPDADATALRAVESGATLVTPVVEAPWGDRVGRVLDPFGNLWWINTQVSTPDDEELARRFADPKYMEAMETLQGTAVEVMRAL